MRLNMRLNNLIKMLLYLRDSYVDEAYYISFMNNTLRSSIAICNYNTKLYSNGHKLNNKLFTMIDGYKLISVEHHLDINYNDNDSASILLAGFNYNPDLLYHYRLLLESSIYDRKKYSILNMQSLNSDIRFISNVIVNVKNDDDYLIRIDHE